MADIELHTGTGPGRRIPILGKRMVIGRSAESDIFLPDIRLSRRHAEIEQRGDGCYLIDLGSTNGTYLNGERVAGEQRLQHGDTIALGDSRLVYSELTPDEAGGTAALLGAQSYSIQDLQSRTTSRSVEMVDLKRQTRILRLLSQATSSLFESMPVERAAILLHDNKTGVVEMRASRFRGEEPITRISAAISRRVLDERVALLIPSVSDDLALRERQSVAAIGIRSAMCAPLWLAPRRGAAEEVIGLIYADTMAEALAFGEDELEILTAFGNVAASKIESTRLVEQNMEKERLEGEMQAAAEILRSILPADPPSVPGCDLSGETRSCDAVGGDYHDYHWDGRELSLTLADVSGKGLGAAMLMTALRSAVHAHWKETSLTSAISRINRTFLGNVPLDRYATCFFARVDPFKGRLNFVNAGHPPALLIRAAGGVERLSQGGPGLGLLDSADYEEGEIALTAGDTLLVYSDGVSEAWDTEPEAEGLLVDLVHANRETSAEVLRGAILTAVDRRRGSERSDDCTLIVLRWSPSLHRGDKPRDESTEEEERDDTREYERSPQRVDLLRTVKIQT
jgi:sigma-B regulation protein RsbU (phosphoserine phosphatase)